MKKNKFAELTQKDASAKISELTKELVKFRVSLDASSLEPYGGVIGLRRDLRLLERKVAIKAQK